MTSASDPRINQCGGMEVKWVTYLRKTRAYCTRYGSCDAEGGPCEIYMTNCAAQAGSVQLSVGMRRMFKKNTPAGLNHNYEYKLHWRQLCTQKIIISMT